jgi:hypothetical protein
MSVLGSWLWLLAGWTKKSGCGGWTDLIQALSAAFANSRVTILRAPYVPRAIRLLCRH